MMLVKMIQRTPRLSSPQPMSLVAEAEVEVVVRSTVAARTIASDRTTVHARTTAVSTAHAKMTDTSQTYL
jgi:hypothetical protein